MLSLGSFNTCSSTDYLYSNACVSLKSQKIFTQLIVRYVYSETVVFCYLTKMTNPKCTVKRCHNKEKICYKTVAPAAHSRLLPHTQTSFAPSSDAVIVIQCLWSRDVRYRITPVAEFCVSHQERCVCVFFLNILYALYLFF